MKSSNVLVTKNDKHVKLADFGLSTAAWSTWPLGSAPARLLCLLRARLAALDSLAL